MPLLDNLELRERARRAKLHGQIAAVNAQLDKLSGPLGRWRTQQYYTLLSKLSRLHRELKQLSLPP